MLDTTRWALEEFPDLVDLVRRAVVCISVQRSTGSGYEFSSPDETAAGDAAAAVVAVTT